jgi:hypothetical protein
MYSYYYVYVFLMLCALCSVYTVFVVPTGILRLPRLRFYRAFSSVVRQMPGHTSQNGARSTLFLISELCCSMYCFVSIMCCCMYCLFVFFYILSCVNVNCTTATGLQLNISYRFIFRLNDYLQNE